MPRPLYPGAVAHVTQRGHNREPTFIDDGDRVFYLHCLREVRLKVRVQVHAYVLMTNHVHLLVSGLEHESIPRLMQIVGRRYVRSYNAKHLRSGTLWEGRYRSATVDSDTYLLACMRYIELNPVRAGIAVSPGDYRWSSFGVNARGVTDPLVTPHPSYLALATDPALRYRNYVGLFGSADDHLAHAIRNATSGKGVLRDAQLAPRETA